MLNKFDLSKRTALITGAAGLLGKEHAAALLEVGARVVLADISESGLDDAVSALSGVAPKNKIETLVMDVSNLDSIRDANDYLVTKGIVPEILVNNAAIDPKVTSQPGVEESTRLENFPLEQWNLQIGVGLTGAFLCSQVFGSKMASSGNGGVILNISSDLSVFSPDQRLYRNEALTPEEQPVKPVTYSVIKTGLIGLTRYLATYWCELGVRANALSPGGVANDQNEGFIKRISSLIPLNRMAEPDEYRAAVQFLCSDASAYMNGQNIVMDGGRSVW